MFKLCANDVVKSARLYLRAGATRPAKLPTGQDGFLGQQRAWPPQTFQAESRKVKKRCNA
jgi:hypothetical protein